MKKIVLLVLLVTLSMVANAQQGVPITNAGSTGTTLNKLVKLTGAPSTALITATTDTAGMVGICAASCGTSGAGVIVNYGVQPCIFDAGNAVAGHYVVSSTATAGDCMDAGTVRPLSGQVVGFALATGSGTQNILLNTAEVVPTGPQVTKTTSSPISVSATDQSGLYYNQHATAGTAITYTLPTAAIGKQFCFKNSYNGSAADTGILTVATSAAGQFIIDVDGTLGSTGGNIASAGAGGDGICAVGVDTTHWQVYVQKGTWTKT